MADFTCRIGTESGEIIEKRFTADSRNALKRELEERGYYIFKIRPSLASFLPGGREGRIKPDDFIIFNQEFQALLKAGLPATQSLQILIDRQGESNLGVLLQSVKDSVETGTSLSDAFAEHRAQLPIAYVSTLVAGERSGELPETLKRFIDLTKLTNSLRKSFLRALYYPAFLIILSLGLLVIMFTYVLPEFSKFYEGFDEELPVFTLVVLGIAQWLQTNILFLLAGIVLFVLLFLWWRKTESGRRALARLKFRLPLIGNLMHKYQLSQIYHSLATMLKGGMPLLTCLRDIEQSTSNPLLIDGLQTAITGISEGESLHGSIEGTALTKDFAVEMIQVGESTGALPDMLSNVASFYDEEVRTKLAALLSLVEPILLVLMAAMIGFLLFAMYYPLFNLLGRVAA